MTPSFSYFLILGLNNISSNFKLNLKGKNVSFQVISVFLIMGLLFSTTTILIDFKKDNTKRDMILYLQVTGLKIIIQITKIRLYTQSIILT